MYKKAIDLFEQVDHPAGLLRTRLAYTHFLTEQGKVEEASQLEQDVRHRATQLGLYLQ
jgi:hypothetical protein